MRRPLGRRWSQKQSDSSRCKIDVSLESRLSDRVQPRHAHDPNTIHARSQDQQQEARLPVEPSQREKAKEKDACTVCGPKVEKVVVQKGMVQKVKRVWYKSGKRVWYKMEKVERYKLLRSNFKSSESFSETVKALSKESY